MSLCREYSEWTSHGGSLLVFKVTQDGLQAPLSVESVPVTSDIFTVDSSKSPTSYLPVYITWLIKHNLANQA